MCSLRSLRSLALNQLGYVKRVSTAFKVPKDGCGVPSAAMALLGPVTKILRKIRATTFTENYGKLRVRGMSAWNERTPLPISHRTTLYLFTIR